MRRILGAGGRTVTKTEKPWLSEPLYQLGETVGKGNEHQPRSQTPGSAFLTSCVASGKLLNLSVPQYSHL